MLAVPFTPEQFQYAFTNTLSKEESQKVYDRYHIPAHTIDLGAKGCVSYRPTPMTNYRDFLETTPELFAASYPWLLNRGIFMTPGDEEQWTLSVQHTDADVDRYVAVFTEFCGALAG